MRGKGICNHLLYCLIGITPAYAGKSTFFPLCNSIRRDHPRLCGEKVKTFLLSRGAWGSPPPMRGKVPISLRLYLLVRITPAYAGKRQVLTCPARVSRDHPRLCGEKLDKITEQDYADGSPPPMRGKGTRCDCGERVLRITPAYAGKSEKEKKQTRQSEDHPRLCGEKEFCYEFFSPYQGSPPPMRGKAENLDKRIRANGITPAYAGKRETSSEDILLSQDHPRLCGEKLGYVAYFIPIKGSPPPMRGKVLTGLINRLLVRITPAYAGKSLAVGALWIHDKDHPRLCGEKVTIRKSGKYRIGSPPPMRGKAGMIKYSDVIHRITPAYAGKRNSANSFFSAL